MRDHSRRPGTHHGKGVAYERLRGVVVAGRRGPWLAAGHRRDGLTGGYDIALTYTPEALSAAALAQRQGGAPALAAGVDPNGPNLFQALQDQLGLKLESRKIPLDIMVIDHVEPPVPE